MKRNNYITWDEYFMNIAILSGHRSKDPSTQVGACIVNKRNKIVGIGYNGFPLGCSDDALPWSKDGAYLETKHPYVCHAELNAVLNATGDLTGCRIYVVIFPCNECAKVIIQSGITQVIYMKDDPMKDYVIAAKRMFNLARVRWAQFTPRNTITMEQTNV